MMIYEVYHDVVSLKVIVRYSFMQKNDWDKLAHFMFNLGFKYVKRKSLFTKCYIDKLYATERFQTDLKSVCDFYKGDVKVKRYKLLEEKVSK